MHTGRNIMYRYNDFPIFFKNWKSIYLRHKTAKEERCTGSPKYALKKSAVFLRERSMVPAQAGYGDNNQLTCAFLALYNNYHYHLCPPSNKKGE